MGKSNAVMQYPSGDYITLHLDRYTAERLLLALTQSLEPSMRYRMSQRGKKDPGKKGKGSMGLKSGLKL